MPGPRTSPLVILSAGCRSEGGPWRTVWAVRMAVFRWQKARCVMRWTSGVAEVRVVQELAGQGRSRATCYRRSPADSDECLRRRLVSGAVRTPGRYSRRVGGRQAVQVRGARPSMRRPHLGPQVTQSAPVSPVPPAGHRAPPARLPAAKSSSARGRTPPHRPLDRALLLSLELAAIRRSHGIEPGPSVWKSGIGRMSESTARCEWPLSRCLDPFRGAYWPVDGPGAPVEGQAPRRCAGSGNVRGRGSQPPEDVGSRGEDGDLWGGLRSGAADRDGAEDFAGVAAAIVALP